MSDRNVLQAQSNALQPAGQEPVASTDSAAQGSVVNSLGQESTRDANVSPGTVPQDQSTQKMTQRNGYAQKQLVPWMDGPDSSTQAAEDFYQPVQEQMPKHGAEHIPANGVDAHGRDSKGNMSAAERMQQMADALVDDEAAQKAEAGGKGEE